MWIPIGSEVLMLSSNQHPDMTCTFPKFDAGCPKICHCSLRLLASKRLGPEHLGRGRIS